MKTVVAALTETRNVYGPMPSTVDELARLAPHLDAIRTANVVHHVELIERAAGLGARIVGLGELFTAPYFALRRDAFWRDMAEDAEEGPTIRSMRETARRLGVVIVAPIYEMDGDERYNTAVVIDADGRVLGRYRKCHIPEGSNEQGSFDEPYYYGRSNGVAGLCPGATSDDPFFPVFETAAGKIGVATCYDRHFEGVVAALARGGAQLVLSPAVTFGTTSRRMWDLEFAVDAARHRLYIGGSNRKGVEPPWNQDYFGASHFVGPQGRLPNQSDDERLIVSELDLGLLTGSSDSGWDLARDARPEIY